MYDIVAFFPLYHRVGICKAQADEVAGMRAAASLQEIINRNRWIVASHPGVVARPDCIGVFGVVRLAGTGFSGMQGPVRQCIYCMFAGLGRASVALDGVRLSLSPR